MIDLNGTFEPADRTVQIKISAFIFLAIVAAVSHLLIKALHDPAIPFLKTNPRANWILYQLPPMTDVRVGNFLNLTAEFSKDFELTTEPSKVHLNIKAFKKYHLWVNDNKLPSGSTTAANWKKLSVLEISQFLQKGLNTIKVTVTCDYGPPALWLYSEGLQKDIKTDTTWTASIPNKPTVKADLANDCIVHPISLEAVQPLDALIKKLPMLILFFAISFAVFCLHSYKQKTKKLNSDPLLRFLTFTPKSVLIISIVLWTILFINNTPKLLHDTGFDIYAHLQYISLRLRQSCSTTCKSRLGSIPSALVLCRFCYNPGIDQTVSVRTLHLYSLKLIPFLCGIGQICLAYFAARILFPNNKTKHALCVAFTAMIPMNIYISHYFSNESLCGFLMVLAILVTIIILNNPHRSPKLFCVLGLIIGLALLTKITTLTILPVIFLILSYKLLSGQKRSLAGLVDYLGLMLLIIVIVAGWFYLRNWAHFGKPFVSNWDRSIGIHWWQDPGFHTYKYFCRFGKVFSLPYFAGFYSFFDSLYATFWADSFVGGQITYYTPWNEEYMSAVYLLSLPAVPIIIIGSLRAIRNAIFSASKIWLLILGSLLIMAYSIIYINLKTPYYGPAKAFYTLAVVLPVSLIFASGFGYLDKWLKSKNLFILRATLYGWFGTLALAIFFAFLIRPPT